MFVFFSDGILDARNQAGDLFSRKGLEHIVTCNKDLPAQVVVDTIFEAVAEHASGVEPFDDQTVVVIKVKGNGSGS